MRRKLMQVLAGFIPAIVALAFYVKYEVVMGAKPAPASSEVQELRQALTGAENASSPDIYGMFGALEDRIKAGERLAAERNENAIALFAATIERLQAQTDEARALAAVATVDLEALRGEMGALKQSIAEAGKSRATRPALASAASWEPRVEKASRARNSGPPLK